MDGINQFTQFLAQHKAQLMVSGVPEHLWEMLYKKVMHEIFDAGSVFSLLLIDYGDEPREECNPVWSVCVSRPEGLMANDPTAIYLIDHALTFRTDQVRAQLEQNPQLSDRLCTIIGVDKDDPNYIDKVLKGMWRHCHCYSIEASGVSVEARMPIWYIMDELGSGINHSDTPNFRC